MSPTAEKNIWTTASAAAPAGMNVALSGEAKDLLTAEQSPRQFVAVLSQQGLGADAVRYIPWCLTRREAVWWAAQCVRTVPVIIGEHMSASAINASEAWCKSPTDENRRAALTAAEMAQIATPAGCVAMAVFFSEGSLAPPKVEVVNAPTQIGPNMAGNAVVLAAVCHQPEKALEKYARFILLADEVALGANRWEGTMIETPAEAPVVKSPSRKFPPYPQPGQKR